MGTGRDSRGKREVYPCAIAERRGAEGLARVLRDGWQGQQRDLEGYTSGEGWPSSVDGLEALRSWCCYECVRRARLDFIAILLTI